MTKNDAANNEVEKTKKTYSQIFNNYAKNNLAPKPYVQKVLDNFINIIPGKKVLDAGCAHGSESKYFASRGFEVTGIDISPEFIELAKSNCPNCTFIVADMRHPSARLKNFDAIWANASFLHIPKENGLTTLEGFNKILKSGGVLYVSVMEGNFNSSRENKQMNWPARHFSDYSQEELENLINKSGFKVLTSGKDKTDWGPTFLNYFCKKI